jgi:hypothetical protein
MSRAGTTPTLIHSQEFSKKTIQSLNDSFEQHYKDILCDPLQRDELSNFIILEQCQNHLGLFDTIQTWRKAKGNEKPDILRHIMNKFLNSQSFHYVQIDEQLLNDLKQEQDINSIFTEVERICVKKIMSSDPRYSPSSSPRLVSPRKMISRCDTPIPTQDKESFVGKIRNRLSWRSANKV